MPDIIAPYRMTKAKGLLMGKKHLIVKEKTHHLWQAVSAIVRFLSSL
jgi:hypothetical protein